MGDSDLTVQRTLVKSPPELWADLSNPESLAKRLGEFGEIRITRLVPEKTVAWEGDRASGTVEIEPSGWGTKVRLSATAKAPASEAPETPEDDLEREMAVEAALRAEIEREAAIEAALRAEIEQEVAIEAALRAEAEAEAEAQAERQRQAAPESGQAPSATAEAEPVDEVADEPARGFFAWFRRRRKRGPAPTAVAVPARRPDHADRPAHAGPPAAGSADRAEPLAQAAAPSRPTTPGQRSPVRLSALAVARANPADRPPRVSTTTAEFDKPGAETITASRRERSETPSKQVLDDEQTLAVLSGVLDDLGSAHHRPFSRE